MTDKLPHKPSKAGKVWFGVLAAFILIMVFGIIVETIFSPEDDLLVYEDNQMECWWSSVNETATCYDLSTGDSLCSWHAMDKSQATQVPAQCGREVG